MTENLSQPVAPPTTAGTGSATGTPAPPAGTVADRAGAAVERAGDVVERAGDVMERAALASGRIASTVVDRLRNDAEFNADRGSTRIEDEVVEKIAGIAARAVPGVHDLGGDTTRLFAAVRERVGLGESDAATAACRSASTATRPGSGSRWWSSTASGSTP